MIKNVKVTFCLYNFLTSAPGTKGRIYSVIVGWDQRPCDHPHPENEDGHVFYCCTSTQMDCKTDLACLNGTWCGIDGAGLLVQTVPGEYGSMPHQGKRGSLVKGAQMKAIYFVWFTLYTLVDCTSSGGQKQPPPLWHWTDMIKDDFTSKTSHCLLSL